MLPQEKLLCIVLQQLAYLCVLLQACLGGYTITPPAVFRLKAGSGPIHISGQHLVSEYS